jgi:3-hydroxybutyryl-CoA dehydrogenase
MINKVLIIGAGTMGSGIAQWFAQQNVETELVDNNPEQVESAHKKILASWEKLSAKGKFSPEQVEAFKSKLIPKTMDTYSTDSDLVIEAIIENLEIKKNLFSELDAKFDSKTIIASNTSSFPIKLLSEHLGERKSRFLGLHFFNPATIMKLVEVIKSEFSDNQIADDLYKWFDKRGKKPALCADSPGFIVNRVARNFYGEPLRVAAEENETRMKEIDGVLKEVAGFRMGPFELMDLIGIDINYSVTLSVWNAYQKEPRFAPHDLQKKMVDEKRFGRKSGRGFYSYE